MPWSEACFDNDIRSFLATILPRRVIDIGAGAGKYGHMVRDVAPDASITGIECEGEYVERFELRKVYDQVHVERAEEHCLSRPDLTTDVVIFGDSLEHMKKSTGIDLIHYFLYRCEYIVAVFPTEYVQYSWEGHRSEAHLSVWSKSDFAGFRHIFRVRGFMNLAIVNGYLGRPNSGFGIEPS